MVCDFGPKRPGLAAGSGEISCSIIPEEWIYTLSLALLTKKRVSLGGKDPVEIYW